MNFEQAFKVLMGHEGGYANDPNDPGGETMYGITIATARRNGYTGPMKDLPLSKAHEIARKEYWTAVRADELPDSVRFDVFDACYHSGAERAAKLLQQSLGFTGRNVDGIIGPMTLKAAREMDPQLLDKRFAGYRLRFLASLSSWPSFARGWARRIATNLIED